MSMTRTEALCIGLGWQGGTVHQVAEATGLTVEDIVYKAKPSEVANPEFAGGWFCFRTCGKDHQAKVYAAKQGNFDFWCGVADAVMLMDRIGA
jgi:hypothetical protein